MLGNEDNLPISADSSKDHQALERLIFFSDAVFAIAITLLALEICLPSAENGLTNTELAKSLFNLWPMYLGYAISFLVIGFFWIGHHRKFRFINRCDNNLLILNLVLLMVIAFIPFPASVISEYGNRTATIFYAFVMVVAGLLSAAVWGYASYHNRLIDPLLDSHYRRKEAWVPLIMSGIFLLSIGIAFFNDDLAKISWVFIAFTTFII